MSIVIRRLKGDLHFVALLFIQKNIRPYSMGKNSCPKPVTGKIVSEKAIFITSVLKCLMYCCVNIGTTMLFHWEIKTF